MDSVLGLYKSELVFFFLGFFDAQLTGGFPFFQSYQIFRFLRFEILVIVPFFLFDLLVND